MGDLRLGCGGHIRPGECHGVLEGCSVGFAGMLGPFPLWWPLLRALLLWWLAVSWARGAGSQGHDLGAPGGIVGGPRLQVGQGYGAILSTPGRWQLLVIGNPECPRPETPSSSPWRASLCLSHPSPHWVLGSTQKRSASWVPPKERIGKASFPGEQTYTQASLPVLGAWAPHWLRRGLKE